MSTIELREQKETAKRIIKILFEAVEPIVRPVIEEQQAKGATKFQLREYMLDVSEPIIMATEAVMKCMQEYPGTEKVLAQMCNNYTRKDALGKILKENGIGIQNKNTPIKLTKTMSDKKKAEPTSARQRLLKTVTKTFSYQEQLKHTSTLKMFEKNPIEKAVELLKRKK